MMPQRVTPATPKHGAELLPDGRCRFRLWAPAVDSLGLEVIGLHAPLPMERNADGWFELNTDQAVAGSRYRFLLPDGMQVPDPASRYQPEDVHGPSELIDSASWQWQDKAWAGRPWEEAVIYELHVGAFTPDGTFLAAIEKLDHLVSIGITAIELMPIADFPGRRNWGYDGVLPYAPDSSYGRPEHLKALVEAAHERGLMVLLDVVYNHFGPDGNYISLYAPQFFTERHKTPWGDAINFDGPGCEEVKNFFVDNAIYWIEQFHMDGLRFDAVHAILDDSPIHVLQSLAERVREAAGTRFVHLLLENEENQAHWLERDDKGLPALHTAQWNDDAHHVLHAVLTGEDKGYYIEYRGDNQKLGRALAEGFAFQGELMEYRGRDRGEVSSHLPPGAFVTFLQNHDQIGNRAFGDRLAATVPPNALRAAAAVNLLLPQTPMLFMGEEWAEMRPFHFFCDFETELGDAVRQGRRKEFERFPEFSDPIAREQIPDPQAEDTFLSSKLDWGELDDPDHHKWLGWYRAVLTKRHEAVVPLIKSITRAGTFQVLGEGAVLVRWDAGDDRQLVLAANLSVSTVSGFPPFEALIWMEGQTEDGGETLQPWTVIWSMNRNRKQ